MSGDGVAGDDRPGGAQRPTERDAPDGHDLEVDRPATGSPAAAVVHALAERGETLAVVESLTGGLLASALVDVAGASVVFRGGLVVYATDLKESLASVPAELLTERGPVDPDVALAMAQGCRTRCAADWALATTGVAGPQTQGGKPVGRLYVAVAGPAGGRVRRLDLGGGRDAVRAASVTAALRLLVTCLGELSSPEGT